MKANGTTSHANGSINKVNGITPSTNGTGPEAVEASTAATNSIADKKKGDILGNGKDHETEDSLRDSLHVVDNRTGKYYNLPIKHNAINASDFKQIKAPQMNGYYADQNSNGIRIFDPGFSNTAVSESKVTYM